MATFRRSAQSARRPRSSVRPAIDDQYNNKPPNQSFGPVGALGCCAAGGARELCGARADFAQIEGQRGKRFGHTAPSLSNPENTPGATGSASIIVIIGPLKPGSEPGLSRAENCPMPQMVVPRLYFARVARPHYLPRYSIVKRGSEAQTTTVPRDPQTAQGPIDNTYFPFAGSFA